MTNIVRFPGALADDPDFVLMMARYSDGLVSESQVRKRYNFDDATWNQLGSDDKLVSKIEAESQRRTRLGETAREKAQKIFNTRVPEVLSSVIDDPNQSARHRIDACKEVRAISAGPENTPAANSRFIITINLNSDGSDHVEHYDKNIAINADDTAPQELLPFASFKKEDDGNGEPL
jgi:hypothetical protein